jgi:hypothetical protein
MNKVIVMMGEIQHGQLSFKSLASTNSATSAHLAFLNNQEVSKSNRVTQCIKKCKEWSRFAISLRPKSDQGGTLEILG